MQSGSRQLMPSVRCPMNDNAHANHAIDLREFVRNRDHFPVEALLPYAGQHVAFSADGTRVMAHGLDYEAVFLQLQKLGVPSSDVVFDYIPGLDEGPWL